MQAPFFLPYLLFVSPWVIVFSLKAIDCAPPGAIAMVDATMPAQTCEQCGSPAARPYQRLTVHAPGVPSDACTHWLCVPCARATRRALPQPTDAADGLTRDELIARLDQFFTISGVFEICARCHAQGTGCCPPTCRIIGPQGCASGKTLFCATFLCGALLNALGECAPETARALQWLKREVGVTEWRVYQMFTRVPASERDAERPLTLPPRYPDPGVLEGAALKTSLAALADEVLEVRRRWHAQELCEKLRT